MARTFSDRLDEGFALLDHDDPTVNEPTLIDARPTIRACIAAGPFSWLARVGTLKWESIDDTYRGENFKKGPSKKPRYRRFIAMDVWKSILAKTQISRPVT